MKLIKFIKWISEGFMRRFWISLFGTALSLSAIYFIVVLGFDGAVNGHEAFAAIIIGIITGTLVSAIFTKIEDVEAGKDN